MEKPSLCPSLAEIDLMKEFRKKIQDLNLSEVELEDKVLVRWLRARNNNLKDAEQMLRKHVEWKVEMDVENIFENGIPPGWDEELPWVLAGFTPSGSAVCISDSVKWDFQRFTTTEQRKKDFARYAILTLEEKWGTALLMGKSRPYVPQLISIYDLKGLSWRQLSSPHAIEVGLNLTRMAEANYPEIVQTLILVNVPRIFQIVWRLLSPFVTDRTKAKIMFLGWDKAEWTREISRHIPLDQFPKEYGGLGDDDVNLFLELDKDYQVYRKRFTWSDALNFCYKCVGDFATFETGPAEASKVADLIYSKSYFSRAYDLGKDEHHEWGLDRRYWFGLTDLKKEGQWVWMKSPQDNGTVVVNPTRYRWYPGQPDHGKSLKPEHCGGFWNPVYHLDQQKSGANATGRKEMHYFNDMPCDIKMYFICKKGTPASPTDPVCSSGEASNVTKTDAPPTVSTEKPAHELGEPYTEAELLQCQATAVKWHNIFRKWHNVPDVTIDAELNKKAQLAAENLVRSGKMEHTSTGENLYLAAHPAGKRRFQAVSNTEFAVREWYFELCDTENWPKGELNHYTQVVWNDSIKLGIGVATNKENSQIHVVARYDPVGNYEGEYDLGVYPIRCGVETVCNGMKPKNITGSEADCPAPPSSTTPKPLGVAAGRSFQRKRKKVHKEGSYVYPKERPIKILDRK
ncbi:hypothetical protein Fcan01_13008 [Folsomia candida]|uniref:Uncharacterized protein n=1 Tax=Folsomia candida TaxID=158441 RepID=A0A226E3L6_FOLCA|nr:hypothetical protein Fcan01_13008 [Folsomia candida]